MQLKKLKQEILRKTGLVTVSFVINVLCKTLKLKFENDVPLKKALEENQNLIAAFWHGKMLIPWYIFRNKKIAAIVSQSKDGEILSRLLKSWNYELIRGSSNIGGKEALEMMQSKMEENFSIAITPDGPTGPANRMKAGAVVLAKKTGNPLFLIGVSYKKIKQFNSWDKFQLPLPFSAVEIVISDPIYIEAYLSYEETSEKILEIETKLNQLNIKADNA